MVHLLADFDTAHCGVVHDAQLDGFGQCLATASADGHVRLWDVRKPKEPTFLSDLGGHAGEVLQVAWAPAEVGVLLASCGSDGRLIIWGRRTTPGEWEQVRSEDLSRHGAIRSIAWGPASHGTVLACVSANGMLTIVAHVGAVRTGEVGVKHTFRSVSHKAHDGFANAVSWALPHENSMDAQAVSQGLAGARIVTCGSNGVRVWRCDRGIEFLEALMEEKFTTPPELEKSEHRDVAWKPWDGVNEMIASATGHDVVIWQLAEGSWQVANRVPTREEVWKITWMELGNILLVSCGETEQRALLLKQQVNGEWDVMDASQVEQHEALSLEA